MWRRVALVRTDVASSYLLLTLFLALWFIPSWWWMQYVPPKRRCLKEPYNVTSHKKASFIVTALNISNLTQGQSSNSRIWVIKFIGNRPGDLRASSILIILVSRDKVVEEEVINVERKDKERKWRIVNSCVILYCLYVILSAISLNPLGTLLCFRFGVFYAFIFNRQSLLFWN
jgi:hypothetical protein